MWRVLLLAAVLATCAIGFTGCGKSHGWQQVADNDPRLEAAREEARSKWPEFVSQFKNKQPFTEYTVEVLYSEGGQSEYLLLQVSKITDTEITGSILGYPTKVQRKSGEVVTSPVSTLSDWTYVNSQGEEFGSFVANARRELERRN